MIFRRSAQRSTNAAVSARALTASINAVTSQSSLHPMRSCQAQRTAVSSRVSQDQAAVDAMNE